MTAGELQDLLASDRESDLEKAEEALRPIIEGMVQSARDMFLGLSEWPSAPTDRLQEPLATLVQEVHQFYRKLLNDGPRNWPILEAHHRYLSEQIEQARQLCKVVDPEQESAVYERLREVEFLFFYRRKVLNLFMRQYMLTFEVPELTDEQAEALAGEMEREQARWEADGRAKGKHVERAMVECYWAFRGSPESEGLGNPKVREKVLGLFGDPVGDRQFENYLSKNPRPQLTEEQIAKHLKDLKDFWGDMLRA